MTDNNVNELLNNIDFENIELVELAQNEEMLASTHRC